MINGGESLSGHSVGDAFGDLEGPQDREKQMGASKVLKPDPALVCYTKKKGGDM